MTLGVKVALAATLIMISMLVPVAITVVYVNMQIHHECQALSLLVTDKQLQHANSQFYDDLVFWYNKDGC